MPRHLPRVKPSFNGVKSQMPSYDVASIVVRLLDVIHHILNPRPSFVNAIL